MTVRDAIFIVVLAFVQVLFLLGSQYWIPEYYFASAQFLVRRAEFKWKAIVFRLAIPFSAGLLIPYLSLDNERLVAVAAGAAAWFLILWPIASAPSLMVPPITRVGVIIGLWGLWWVFFAFLPVLGVAASTWIREVLSDPRSEWWQAELASELLWFVPLTFLVILSTRFVNREVPLIGGETHEEPPMTEEVVDDEEAYWDDAPSERRSWREPAEWHWTAAMFSIILMPFLLIAIIVAILLRVGRWRTTERER